MNEIVPPRLVLRRHQSLELLKPVEDHVELFGARFRCRFDHQKVLAVERDVVVVETIGLDDEVSFEQSLRSFASALGTGKQRRGREEATAEGKVNRRPN